jgi:subtilisin family serine protease
MKTWSSVSARNTGELRSLSVASILPLSLTLEMDGDPETPGDGISMALGDRPIPEFLKLSTGCDDPNTVKVAIIDGGIDLSHGDFGYCSRGFCEGRRFMSPTDQDWGESKNNHGSHVAGVSSPLSLIGW